MSAPENGTALLVSIAGTQVSCQTDDTSLSLTRDLIETTCKDATGSAKTYIAGEKDATIDVTAAYVMDATYGFTDLFSVYDNGTEVAWTWGSTAAGDRSYSGQGLISDLSVSGPQNDRSTYSFTLQETGEITESTNPT